MRTLVLLALAGFAAAGRETSGVPNYRLRDDKLQSLVSTMWRKDADRVVVRPDYQQHVSGNGGRYDAPRKLFNIPQNEVRQIRAKPIYQKYEALMDNYIHQTGRAEDGETNRAEQREEAAFLGEVLNSGPMREVYASLHRDRHPYARDPGTWKESLKKLWFGMYSRARGVQDTSGFEHVFIGEIKNGEVSGLHNWYQFLALEQQNKLDYKGFVVRRKDLVASLKFDIADRFMKNSGSLLIGTSPAFDMSLYTLCFLTHRGRDTCNVKLDGCEVRVTSHAISQARRGSGRSRRNDFVGSIYPAAGRPCR